MKHLVGLITATAGTVLLSATFAAPSMAQMTPPPSQMTPPSQPPAQQMDQRNQMQRQDQMQQGRQAQAGAAPSASTWSRVQPLPGNQMVSLLNTLSAQGYQPRGNFERSGNVWQMPAVNPQGQPATVTLDPGSGQVMARSGSGAATPVASIPPSRTGGSMSGGPDRTTPPRR
jgi:hypothetical protein